jgi:hypothetical protein
MIPDEVYQDFKDKMLEMKFKSFKDYQQRLLAGSEFEMKDVRIGDIVEVPDWYFEAHKNDMLTTSVFIENYKDKMGRPHSFDMQDAIKHGHVTEDTKPTRQISRFTIIEEPALTHKKSTQRAE